jgi:hypothetical protein
LGHWPYWPQHYETRDFRNAVSPRSNPSNQIHEWKLNVVTDKHGVHATFLNNQFRKATGVIIPENNETAAVNRFLGKSKRVPVSRSQRADADHRTSCERFRYSIKADNRLVEDQYFNLRKLRLQSAAKRNQAEWGVAGSRSRLLVRIRRRIHQDDSRRIDCFRPHNHK